MPHGFITWRPAGHAGNARVAAPPAFALAGAAGPQLCPAPPEPRPEAAQPLAARDEAVFLLHTAAEIEHALLVQYLYAAFSFGEPAARLRANGGDLEPEPHAKVFGPGGWDRTLLDIAVEEMFHLMTVQNVLRAIGGPLNLEREDMPFRSEFYPFPFTLEPVTKASLARYVAAEMPARPDPAAYPLLPEILARARVANHQGEINRVGALYARILELLGRVPSDAFRPETANGYQADPAEWGGSDATALPANKRARILARFGGTPSETKNKVRAVLSLIAEQGEGPGSDPTGSHFDLFYQMYKDFPETDADHGAVLWHPAVPVPRHPSTSPAPFPDPDLEAGRVTHGVAVRWAKVFNTRYRMLLHFLLHHLLTDGSVVDPDGRPRAARRRAALLGWAFTEMQTTLREVSNVLARLPRRGGAPFPPGRPPVAGAPFELPYTLNLPDRDADRWQLHRDVLDAAEGELADLTGPAGSDRAIARLRAANRTIRAVLAAPDPFGAGDSATIGFAQVVEILDQAVGGPAGAVGPPHRAFWRGLTRDQFVAHKVLGHSLVAVGNGAGSALVKALKGEPPFDGSEFPRMPVGSPPVPGDRIARIEKWIDAGCPGAAAPTAPTPREQMIELLKAKRPLARSPGRHGGVPAGGEVLSTLFEQERYADILQFLQTGAAGLPPAEGTPLVAPKNPGGSGLFIQITAGVMTGRFTADEVAVVERWINSL
ncbi:Oxygen-dependent dichlorochromopyrrolate synthase [Gemmata obscuriglobus]|uniref:ferritin-like domain-containing protein n=1 Tax=Gemmata obscuriglobus TaxID=114 RepID=UPI00016C48B6|nr:ferritin-like domain-containing protein [Gemmata obscuriglobus]QEG30620.1 Oxygen-dependent dichlorochromopyrrolate synthase [Gemmata obscuriglobus]VTS09944.1 Uncharacterized protein OS=Cystobacter violaceus Cb vi76 GN=Q664_00295 PE=4 SV=1: Ferritin-like [Gemmata obscuriglobus UQM 2246]